MQSREATCFDGDGLFLFPEGIKGIFCTSQNLTHSLSLIADHKDYIAYF